MPLLLTCLSLCWLACANLALAFELRAQPIATDTWMVEADTGYFTPENGGFLVNTAFIATEEGVVVIGSGPSRRFGEQYRQLIEQTTGKRILEVIITHKHPDHFLGNQAFSDVPIRADATTTAMIRAEGEGLAENLYRLVGDGMRGTEALAPTAPLPLGMRTIGSHRLEFLSVPGHTQSDIAILDHSTGVLFAIDQVFNQRTPTLPNANLANWHNALNTLQALPFKLLVPGHGPVSQDAKPIEATRDYLTWLDDTLRQAAERGLAATEVMQLPIPARFAQWGEAQAEWRRSIGFRYSQYERAALPWLTPAR